MSGRATATTTANVAKAARTDGRSRSGARCKVARLESHAWNLSANSLVSNGLRAVDTPHCSPRDAATVSPMKRGVAVRLAVAVAILAGACGTTHGSARPSDIGHVRATVMFIGDSNITFALTAL